MKTGKFGLALLAVTGVALACEMYTSEFVTPPVSVSVKQESAEFWEQLGDKLDALYGSNLTNVELPVVRVPVMISLFGVAVGTHFVTFLKACDETFKQAADRLADEVRDGYATGGGGSYDDPFAGGGTDPWKDCMNGTKIGQACISVDGGTKVCENVIIDTLICPAG